jgi:hypothetical protein
VLHIKDREINTAGSQQLAHAAGKKGQDLRKKKREKEEGR